MKKQTINRKTVKDRIKEWVKAHPDGIFYEKELRFYPYRGNKRVKSPHTLEEWLQLTEDDTVEWRIMPVEPVVDDEIESHIQDRNKLPTSKGRKRKEKNWLLEYKWISREDFEKRSNTWIKAQEYHQEWIEYSFFNKHASSNAALNRLKQDVRSSYMANWIRGRFWRARNKKTGETIEFPNIINYYND